MISITILMMDGGPGMRACGPANTPHIQILKNKAKSLIGLHNENIILHKVEMWAVVL